MWWKKFKRGCWQALLFSPSWRRRLAFQLKSYYPEDLDVRVALGHGLWCPAFDEELGTSFAEVFIEAEYSGLLAHPPLPRRWVDLGCYAGFFSLWLLWHLRREDPSAYGEALLIDADTRHQSWLQRLIQINKLGEKWKYLHGAIAGEDRECEFVERGYMGSSLRAIDNKPGRATRVAKLETTAILQAFPGPYDLIKLDIEGAEYEFFLHYGALAQQSRRLLVEWHSWHRGGGGPAEIVQMAAKIGFCVEKEVQLEREAGAGKTGVILFCQKNT